MGHPKMKFRTNTMNRHRTQASAGCLIPFSLVWMAFSSVFIYLGLFGTAGKSPAGWETVPCVIEKFEITDDPAKDDPFGVAVEFRYQYRGAVYTGTRTDKEDRGYRTDDYHEMLDKRSKMMAKPEAECLVPDQDPSAAVLKFGRSGDRVGGIVFAIFGGCFFLIGVGLFVSAIREVRRGKRVSEGGVSVTTTSSEETPRLILIPFFSLFALAGTGLLFGLIVPMWKDWMAAKSWVEVPGEVIWNRINSHRGDDSTTYSAHVFYRYEFGGRTYQSDRRGFGKSSGSMKKAEENRAKYAAGSRVAVYVDPSAPERAVLQRELGGEAWFSLFPLPFMAVGFGGLYWMIRGAKKRGYSVTAGASKRGNRGAAAGLAALAPGESVRLAPGKGRVLKAVGILAVAAFWNGIVSIFVVQLFQGRAGDGFSWGLGLFLIPFVLVGLVLIGAFFHQAGAMFNPRPVLHLDGGQPRLGVNLGIRYEIAAGAGRLKSLRIVLRGEEVATYRRGTNSVTERSIFHEVEVLATEMVEMMRAGRGSTRIPADLVPSWKSSNNRIEWTLVVEGTIAFWPDISDRYPIQVLPA